MARRATSPYDEIIFIDGDQGSSHLVRGRNDQEARSRIGQTETFGLDPRRGVNHGRRDEIDEAFDQIRPAGRNIQHPNEMPLVVVKRGRRAAQQRIACIEVLVAVDRQCAMLDQAGSDTVRTLAVFAPDCARP